MTHVKICGNTQTTDVRLAVELGVDLLGFIFTRSKRQIDVQQGRTLIDEVPDGVQRVGVFNDEPPAEIARVAAACRLSAIQLYRRPTAEDRALGLLMLPGVRVQDGQALAIAVENGDHPLLDTWTPDGLGGTGRTWSWAQAQDVARRFPVVVSGGLTPFNVAGAVRQLRPWGVDVCSGVEAQPGHKDPGKLRAFVAAVRQADAS
jgi:phosphoribosylanthranilate isomerase